MAIKTLKAANSPLYGLERKVTDIREAVTVLGFKEVYRLVMTMTTINLFKKSSHIDYRRFWRHSLSVAFATKAVFKFTGKDCLAEKDDILSDLFIAGLLHDIGVLAMDQFLPGYEEVIGAVYSMEDVPFYGVEYEIMKISHGEVGGHLLLLWNMPEHLTTAVAFHHLPEMAPVQRDFARIIHIADFICNNQSIDNGIGAEPTSFSDEAWNNLGISVDDIKSIIEHVRAEAAKSPLMLALA
jgi:HD-like signal output (HDOD) protein